MDEPNDKKATPEWAALLDELKAKESLSSDAKLAEILGVTRGYICSVRKGRKNISLALAKRIFSLLGRTFEANDFEQLFVPVKVRQYTNRLSVIRQQVILRAQGVCQLCGMEAPFRDPNGFPYLEVHHIVPVSEGGSSDLNNLIAVCPNCNRKIACCPSPEDIEKLEDIAKVSASG